MSAVAAKAAPRAAPVSQPGQAGERQARAAARSAMAGALDVGRRLTPASAARAPLFAEAARPLPGPMRRSAEAAFGADFSAVRLHTGPQAAAFAAAHGAEALTAGRDVIFAAGAFRSDDAGQELVLHELAHVLQQTGRRTHDGRLAATDVSGAGPFQRQETPDATQPPARAADGEAIIEFGRQKLLAGLKQSHAKLRASLEPQGKGVWARITFKDIVDGHRPAGATTDWDDLAKAIAPILGLGETQDASWTAAAWPELTDDTFSAAQAKLLDLQADKRFSALFAASGGAPGPGYGLLYDIYKKLGRFGEALSLLAADPRLQTLHWHGQMHLTVDSAEGRDDAGILVAAKTEAAGLIAQLDRRANQVAFVPAEGVEPLMVDLDGTATPIGEWVNKLLNRVVSQTVQLSPNELVFGVYFGIMFADVSIEGGVHGALTDAKAPLQGRTTAQARYGLARAFATCGSAYAQTNGDDHGFLAMVGLGPIGEKLEAAGRRAMPFWAQVVQEGALSFGQDPALQTDPVGQAVRKSLDTQSKAFFALEDDAEEQLPGPQAYQTRVAKWRRALGDDVGRVDRALGARRAELDRKSLAQGAGRDSDLMRDHLMEFYGLLLSGLSDGLASRLSEYDAAEDQRTTQVLKVEDVRGVHRLRLAGAVVQLARAAGWTEIQAQAQRWYLSRDRAASHVYLLSDWEESGPDLNQLSRFPQEVDKVDTWPVDGAGLSLIYQALETRLRATTLEQLMQTPPPGERPLHREVDRAVGDLPRPRRWEVKRYVISLSGRLSEALEKAGRAAVAEENARRPPGSTPAGDTTATPEAPDPAAQSAAVAAPSTPAADADATAGPPASAAKAEPDVREIIELLAEHPRTQALLHRLQSASTTVGLALPPYNRLPATIAPFAIKGMWPVYAWEIPDFDVIINEAKKSPILNQRVLNALAQEETPPGIPLDADSEAGRAAIAKIPDNTRWVDLFRAGGGLDAATAVGSEMDLADQLTHERQRYRRDLRKAAVRERRQLVARHQKALAEKDLTVRVFAPDNALHDLQGVVTDIFPSAQIALDRDASLAPPLGPLADVHQTLAVLELANDIKPGIDGALGNYDTALLAGYLALLPKVIPAAEALQPEAPLVKEALDTENGETLSPATDNIPVLRQLLQSAELQRVKFQVSMGIRGEVAQEKSSYDAFKEKHPDFKKFHDNSPELRTFVKFFGADQPNPAFVNGIKHGTPLTPESQFGDWTLKDVHNAFTYLPSFIGDKSRDPKHPGFRKGWVFAGYRQDSDVQELGEKTLNAGGDDNIAGELLAPDTPLMTLTDSDGQERVVFARDTVLLDSLTGPINIGSILSSLEQTAEMLKFMMDLITDVVATLFGGLGEAGKISAELLQIVASDEFQTLVENFQKDPTKIVDEVIETVRNKVLDPAYLLKFLLFPQNSPLDVLINLAKGDGAPRKPSAPKKRSLFGTVINGLLNLGRHVAAAFDRLHKKFEGPMSGLRGAVVTRPRLRWALDMVAKYGPMIVTVVQIVQQAIKENPSLAQQIAGLVTGEGSKREPENVAEDPRQDADVRRKASERDKEGPSTEGGGIKDLLLGIFVEKVEALDDGLAAVMTTLAQMELPQEVVKLEVLVEAILNLLLKLAARTAKGKVAGFILQRSGLVTEYAHQVAEQLRSDGADPNRVWRDYFLPDLGPRFTAFRDDAVDGVYEGVNWALIQLQTGLSALTSEKVEIKKFDFPRDKREPITVAPAAGDYSAGMMDPEILGPFAKGGATLPSGPGAPLADGVRAAAEARFGHDFRHVRLHAGRDGEAAADPVGALALTSGSHIYVSPRVSLGGDRGRSVLDHELTHVLQQTGARPLGQPNDDRPRRGAARKGLRFDRRDEREADATARAVHNRVSADPVPITPHEDEDRIAPVFDTQTAFDVVGLFASYRDITKFAAGVDSASAGRQKSNPMDAMAVGLWRDAISGPLADSAKGYAKTFESQQANIVGHLNSHSKTIEKAIPVILHDTWSVIPAKKAKGDAKAQPESYEFRSWSFAGTLSAYLFATTGVSITFDIGVDSADKNKGVLKGAKVNYLNLGKVPLDHALWTELTWSGKYPPELRRELGARMAVLDPAPGVWKSNSYELDGSFLSDMSERSKKRPTAKLPTKDAYTATGAKDREGLRFGTHGTLTTAKKGPFGDDRESHHTTQFLLAQYFHNVRRQTPFREGVYYPGVQRLDGSKTGGPVSAIAAPGKKDIQVRSTFGEGGRGDPMPAILIAAETHRQGRLHVGREGKWISSEEQGGSFTQGYAIDNQFRGALPPWLGRLEAKTTEELTATRGKHTEDEVRAEIFKAAQATYRWMYDGVMGKALSESLPRNELAYYRGLAARVEANFADKAKGQLMPAYDLKASEMDSIGNQARQRNIKAMADFGWVL